MLNSFKVNFVILPNYGCHILNSGVVIEVLFYKSQGLTNFKIIYSSKQV